MKFERLLELREDRFWTQSDLAKRLNISQRAYSHYESGSRQLPVEILIELAGIYHTSTDYILGLTNRKKRY